ncbi:MAG: YncE family protein [Myxococcota bacterium]
MLARRPRLLTVPIALAIFSLCWSITSAPTPAAAQTDFIAFESGPVRPIALSPDGTRLFIANASEAHLEVWDLTPTSGPEPLGSIPVGLEPVAVLPLDSDTVWVVNHLSDSVSIVSVAAGRVTRTLLVGDEPRDIVVADPPGAVGPRVFISTAHRGQHREDPSIAAVPGAGDPQLTTPGVGRADVWVFDPANLGATLGGTPLEILSFFADTPRALATSPDGSHVFVAAFNSGNQTTVVSEGIVCDGFTSAGPCPGDGVTVPGGLAGGFVPGGNPGPDDDHEGVAAPEVGLIVKWNGAASQFQDEDGRNWTNGVRFTLPDRDVFAIDVNTLNETATHSSVGTTLFNMITNPVTGKLYVSNTESGNLTRFEGPGNHGGSTVQGNLAQSRITVIDTPSSGASPVTPRHLNKHINYAVTPAPAGVKDHSLAIPTDMAISPDGNTLYIAAFGSSKIGVFNTTALEDDSFTPNAASHLSVTGGGPGGLTLSNDGSRLYVYTRFDNAFSVLDTGSGAELFHLPLPNAEPSEIVAGRPFLYDAFSTSSNGEASCASCHIFGDMDHLAWDLGNPDDEVTSSPMQINLIDLIPFIQPPPVQNGGAGINAFHPMKGPMTTQTLKGMINSGPMHWRGDRSNGVFGTSAFDTELSFNNFAVAFSGLLGNTTDPSEPEMQVFTDFALRLTLPPNPVRALDNTLNADEQAGHDFYFGPRLSDGVSITNPGSSFGETCNGCHEVNAFGGRFGTDTRGSFEAETQTMKVAHLRNMVQKIGMFGTPQTDFESPGDNSFQGDQIRGFGFLHDGSTDTLFRFFNAVVFSGQNDPNTGFLNDNQKRQMEDFMLAFENDLAPIVGQQVTLTSTNAAVADPRINLLFIRANTSFVSAVLGGSVTECDLIAKGTVAGESIGWLYLGAAGAGAFGASDGTTTSLTAIRALAAETDITFTCVPPGSGTRMALNQDRDLHLDNNDNCPGVPNDDQLNEDGDALGDACDPTPVPEPGMIVMLLAGLAFLRSASARRKSTLA